MRVFIWVGVDNQSSLTVFAKDERSSKVYEVGPGARSKIWRIDGVGIPGKGIVKVTDFHSVTISPDLSVKVTSPGGFDWPRGILEIIRMLREMLGMPPTPTTTHEWLASPPGPDWQPLFDKTLNAPLAPPQAPQPSSQPRGDERDRGPRSTGERPNPDPPSRPDPGPQRPERPPRDDRGSRGGGDDRGGGGGGNDELA